MRRGNLVGMVEELLEPNVSGKDQSCKILKNATVVVKVCPKNYLFCIPTNFLTQLFDIFTQMYLPYL